MCFPSSLMHANHHYMPVSDSEASDTVFNPVVGGRVLAAIAGYDPGGSHHQGQNGNAAHRTGSHVRQRAARLRLLEQKNQQTGASQQTKDAQHDVT